MKKSIIPVSIAVLLFFAANAGAATQVGLGGKIGLTLAVDAELLSFETLYFPILIDNDLIVEPSIRYHNRKGSTFGSGLESTQLHMGFGVFKIVSTKNDMHKYFGARLGFIQTTQKYEGSVEDKSTGYLVGPTMGLLYQLSQHSSIAVEGEYQFSTVDAKDYDSFAEESSTNTIKTQALISSIIFRLYF